MKQQKVQQNKFKVMKKLILILGIAVIAAGCTKNGFYTSADEMVNQAAKEVIIMPPQELNTLMEEYEVYTLIDVRQELEHYYGFIPGTVNIPRGSLEFKIHDEGFWDTTGLYMPEKDERIILYCEKGHRSILAAESLMKLGFTQVYVLNGGWKNWELSYPDIYEKDLDKLSGETEKPASAGSC